MKLFTLFIATNSALLSATGATDDVGFAPSASINTRRLEDGNQPWDNGTKVFNNFPNEGWWSGTITSYDPTTGMYAVTWEDGSTDYYDDDGKIDEMVAYARNDPQNNPAGAEDALPGQYPVGTAVSVYEDGKWYDGVIINSNDTFYTVKWTEDKEIEQIQAGAIMDQMVVDAKLDDDGPPAGYESGSSKLAVTAGAAEGEIDFNYSAGTPVSIYENGEWQDGSITRYSNGAYTVVWRDGSVDIYDDTGSDLEELRQAVEDAKADDDTTPLAGTPPSFPSFENSAGGPKFPNGTPVSDFEDGYWVDGVVVAFQNSNYIVKWTDEQEVEFYASSNSEDMQELTKMAEYANGDDDAPPGGFYDAQELWENGTRVAVEEGGSLYMGSIMGFNKKEYTIKWDDGETEHLDNFDLVNQMVSNATMRSPSRAGQMSGMSTAGKAFLSLFLVTFCIAGSIFGYKLFEKRQIHKAREQKVSKEGDAVAYRDEPDQLPKII